MQPKGPVWRRAMAFVATVLMTIALTGSSLVSGCAADETPNDAGPPASDAETPEDEPDAEDESPETGETDEASEGARLVNSRCTRCHSLTRVDAAMKDRAGWETTVDRMIRNGADVSPEERETIVDYLTNR